MTTNLLHKLLRPSILFEHDHGEVEIWLSGLPNLSTLKDPSQRAWLVVQQIHLLSFLDECARRCMKTPYRYIEETLTLLPNYFDPTVRPYELVSPLFMTVLEQLRAKINGQLIATEAAGVILAYLGRVIVGMAGKFKDGKWLEEVVHRLEVMVKEARERGQERKGLLGSVQRIRRLVTEIFGGDLPESTEEAAVKMIDEEWVCVLWNGDGTDHQGLGRKLFRARSGRTRRGWSRAATSHEDVLGVCHRAGRSIGHPSVRYDPQPKVPRCRASGHGGIDRSSRRSIAAVRVCDSRHQGVVASWIERRAGCD
jgi:hypothetical protein